MEFKPHEYQEYTIQRMVEQPKLFAILDMGLGKTVCTLTAIDRLMRQNLEVGKVLVIAPLRVAETTWSDEVNKWEHLKGLRVSKVLGTALQREKALNAQADIYTINRENVQWLVDYYSYQKRKWPFDMMVVDESSSFKNSSSQRFKALKRVVAKIPRVILLTGTPDPNSLLELWPQMYLLDQGERLSKSVMDFRFKYFKPVNQYNGIVYEYAPRPHAKEEIYERISDITISLKAADHIKLPERIDNIVRVPLPKTSRKQYTELEQRCLLQLQSEQATVVANNKAVLTGKLLQFCNGAIYSQAEDGTSMVSEIHDKKIEALKDLLEDNAGNPTLVYYSYKHDYDRLAKALAKYNPETLKKAEDIARWNNGEIKLLLAHPASMGHGLNLQAGGSNIVWFGVPWSLELFQQANARLYRQGQTKSVVISYLLMDDTIDIDVYNSLTKKSINQDELISAIKQRMTNYLDNNIV